MLRVLLILCSFSLNSFGTDNPKNLEELLQKVKSDKIADKLVNQEREELFLREKNKQQSLLNKANQQLELERKRSERLKSKFDVQEKKLAVLEEKLRLTMGSLGELFGIVRQVSGDTKGIFETSIISAEFPDRTAFVDQLSRRKELPETEDLEKLWIALLTQMTESGKTSLFKASVVSSEGKKESRNIVRIGSFNLVSQGKYLTYNSENKSIIELSRQPQGRYLSMIEDYESLKIKEGLSPIGLDPSRGTILSALGQAPSLMERFKQGKEVGYVILVVLVIGLGISVERFTYLTILSRKINDQLENKLIDQSNPLGQIFKAYEEHVSHGIEALELKLEEAIIKSSSKIERGLGTIKILASIAPLLGLLGTVTGMIGTFQSMMLFGTGDPKIMAGGISQALVTTVLGLVAAIPLILIHSFVSGKSKTILAILEEQSIGLMASRTEKGN